MRPLGFAVEDALAAVDAADRAAHRPHKAAGKQGLGAVLGAHRGDPGPLALDARQRLGVRSDHLGGQAVDALQLVLAWLYDQALGGDAAVGMAHLEGQGADFIASEADQKDSLGGHPDGPAVEAHQGVRLGGADHQPALDQRSLEGDLMGREGGGVRQ